jgi:hypothetical protein
MRGEKISKHLAHVKKKKRKRKKKKKGKRKKRVIIISPGSLVA